MYNWLRLTKCFGKTIENPNEIMLKDSIQELFKIRDSEHPNIWIEIGYDFGKLIIVSIYYSGYATYTEYADLDMEAEVINREIKNINIEKALELWLKTISENA